MSTETEILALFEEGNPVPDIEGLETVDLDAAAYLATLQERSSEMTQLDIKPEETEGKRRRRGLIIALAGAAIVILVVAMALLQGDRTPVVDEPEPVPTTAELEVPTTPAVEESESVPLLEPGVLGAGEFRTPDTFAAPFRITLPADWEVRRINDLQMELRPPTAEETAGATEVDRQLWITFEPWTMQERIDLYARADMTLEQPTTTMLAGVEVEYVHFDPPEEVGALDVLGGWTYDWYFVDVAGTRLWISVQARDDVFDEFAVEAAPVLETIVFTNGD